MKIAQNIAQTIDHTLLKTSASTQDIINLCEQANHYQFKAVCIPPIYIEKAKALLSSKVELCTVIGFPLGYNLTKTKLAECQNVLELGATEVDMVININWLKDAKHDQLKSEISSLAQICHDRSKILKVIIETSELSFEQKRTICEICIESQADFVKTSTGFSSSGANLDDIKLMREILPAHMKIKASGGIKNLNDVQAFLAAGADRLGMSAGVNIMRELDTL